MPELSEKARLVADRYEEAYYRFNGKEISVVAVGSGWYTIKAPGTLLHNTFKRHRLSEIEEMAKRLKAMAEEKENGAKREGYIVFISPPRTDRYRNMTVRYLNDADGWTHDRECPRVKVFDRSSEADEVARDINDGLPFKYAEVKPF